MYEKIILHCKLFCACQDFGIMSLIILVLGSWYILELITNMFHFQIFLSSKMILLHGQIVSLNNK